MFTKSAVSVAVSVNMIEHWIAHYEEWSKSCSIRLNMWYILLSTVGNTDFLLSPEPVYQVSG